MQREIIIYGGITFARYPESKSISRSRYFYPFVKVKDGNKISILHRQVWKDAYGEIPEGYDIHHKNGEFLNNSIENLECVSKKEHAARHDHTYTPEMKEHLDKVRPLTKEWHASEEGHKWHSEHGKKVFRNLTEITRTCVQCGGEYLTKCTRENIRFCSRACLNKYNEQTKRYFTTGVCEICGAEFKFNPRRHQKCCSYKCAGVARHNKNIEKKQVNSHTVSLDNWVVDSTQSS